MIKSINRYSRAELTHGQTRGARILKLGYTSVFTTILTFSAAPAITSTSMNIQITVNSCDICISRNILPEITFGAPPRIKFPPREISYGLHTRKKKERGTEKRQRSRGGGDARAAVGRMNNPPNKTFLGPALGWLAPRPYQYRRLAAPTRLFDDSPPAQDTPPRRPSLPFVFLLEAISDAPHTPSST